MWGHIVFSPWLICVIFSALHEHFVPKIPGNFIMAPIVGKGTISVAFVRPSVCLSVAYVANNSRPQRRSVPNFGRKVPHFRCDSHTSFKVKSQRSKVKVTRPFNADTHRAPYLPNDKAYELQTWYTDGWRRPASDTSLMRVKDKLHKSKVEVTIMCSHRLYVSSLPLLNSGNKMLYLCRQRQAGAYCILPAITLCLQA